jgi:WD40 repeat protein
MIGHEIWSHDLADYPSCMAVSPAGRVLTGSLGGDVVIIDGATGRRTELRHHEMGVLSAGWDPSGRYAAVGGQDGTARIYSDAGDLLGEVLTDDWVNDLSWSPEGSILAVASGKSLSLVSVDATILQHCEPLSSTITAVAWAATGLRVGAAAYGGIAWYDPDRITNGRPTRQHEFKGSALSIALAPSGRWACAGFQDATIHLWKLWSGDELSMSGYPAKIELISFSPDSQWMVSACIEELTFWDFSGRGPKGRTPARGALHERHVSCVAWDPTGQYLLSGGGDGRLVMWPAPRRAGEDLEPVFVHQTSDPVSAVGWDPSGERIYVGYASGRVECRGAESHASPSR